MSETPTIRRGRSCFCKHHRATVSIGAVDGGPVCSAGVDRTEMIAATRPRDAKSHLPCFVPASFTMGRGEWNPLPCDRADFPSPEEAEAAYAESDRFLDCIRRGVSPCCAVPLDTGAVIKSGQHKNHGPRFCSKCGRCVYMV